MNQGRLFEGLPGKGVQFPLHSRACDPPATGDRQLSSTSLRSVSGTDCVRRTGVPGQIAHVRETNVLSGSAKQDGQLCQLRRELCTSSI